ncbi:hypothetical protein GLOIN_2v1718866 [Rhizophagus clarus]|uniref:Uncharacterized protein n=1 Tax=Rhizophagus clarus TaxID=94130 RepID=A0A8H3M698_9GLOM|nr:hypothetical protein GLOIN_2v1718866 [Rhizophagus clarus]
MYRPKGYNNNNYGDQQLWIKVDLREIRFYPSREVHEIRIPLDQITRFRIIQNKHIEFEFCKDFKRIYFVHYKNNQNSHIAHKSQQDPTSGCMKDATRLMLTPCDKVHPMTIFMFEIGIKKWAPRLIESENHKDEIQIHEDLIIEDSPSIASEYLMTCNFMDFTRDIRLPAEITFADLLNELKMMEIGILLK